MTTEVFVKDFLNTCPSEKNTMKAQLQPIKPKRISDQVIDQLRELIFRGELKPGDKIMPERELSRVLNVSRTSVREAIHNLAIMGFLEQRQGQGTFVRSPDGLEKNPLALAVATQEATLIDLLEVRMGMECNAAALAAQRADEKDILLLEKSLENMKEDIEAGMLGNEGDVSFHMAITCATKNPLQVYLMKNFFDFLFLSIRENLKYLYEDLANTERIIQQHTRIVQAVKNRDPEEAYQAMREHISFVTEFFREIGKGGRITL
jgi:GntR family transcriptional repressor for pyruvate dehydrogenase complex